jgi:centlein
MCFETTKSNEVMLRQSVVNLQGQLFQKEQENVKLKEKLEESQGTAPSLSPHDSDSSHSGKVRDFLKHYLLIFYVLFVNMNVVDGTY